MEKASPVNSHKFVSAEPFLGEIDLTTIKGSEHLDWVISGGESGRKARPTNLDHHGALLEQSRDLGLLFFEKQLGKLPGVYRRRRWRPYHCKHKKGADIREFPERLKVREHLDEMLAG